MLKSETLKNKVIKMRKEAQDLLNSDKVKEAKDTIDRIKELQSEIKNAENEEKTELEKLKAKANNLKGGEKMTVKDQNGNILNIVNKNEKFAELTNSQNKENLNLSKFIKGMVTGNWIGAEKEREEFKALSTSTGTVLVPRPLSSQIIDLARNKMVLSDIPIIPMESNNLRIAKIASDPEFDFKKELAVASTSDMTFEGIDLKTKMVYGLMKISLELFNSAANLETVIQNAMAQAIAQAIDKAGIYGLGYDESKSQYEPLGITNNTGINVLSEVEPIETSKYTSFVNGIGSITKANGTPTHIAYNSDIDTSLNLLTDTTGQPLNKPQVLNNIITTVSNSIADNESLIYDNNSILMGLQKNITIDTSAQAGFNDGSIYFRVYAMIDFAVLNPKHITHIKYKTA